MTDGIDAPVDSVQLPAPQSQLNRLLADPQVQQLPPCDYAVLAPGQPRDQPIDPMNLRFPPYTGVKSRFSRHEAILQRGGRRVGYVRDK